MIPARLVQAAAEASCTCSLPDGSLTYHRTCEELARRALAAAFAALPECEEAAWKNLLTTIYDEHGEITPRVGDALQRFREAALAPEFGEGT